MIPYGNGWHYLAVKKLSSLLREITSKHSCNIYCLNCLNSFKTQYKLKAHKKVYENKDFCNIIIPSEDTKILVFNQYQKSEKASCFIYVDVECLIEMIDWCKINPENSSVTKVGKQIPSCFSMSTILSFKSKENKHDIYRGKNCMKKFCESLREHTMKITNYKKKKIKLLTKE